MQPDSRRVCHPSQQRVCLPTSPVCFCSHLADTLSHSLTHSLARVRTQASKHFAFCKGKRRPKTQRRKHLVLTSRGAPAGLFERRRPETWASPHFARHFLPGEVVQKQLPESCSCRSSAKGRSQRAAGWTLTFATSRP